MFLTARSSPPVLEVFVTCRNTRQPQVACFSRGEEQASVDPSVHGQGMLGLSLKRAGVLAGQLTVALIGSRETVLGECKE